MMHRISIIYKGLPGYNNHVEEYTIPLVLADENEDSLALRRDCGKDQNKKQQVPHKLLIAEIVGRGGEMPTITLTHLVLQID